MLCFFISTIMNAKDSWERILDSFVDWDKTDTLTILYPTKRLKLALIIKEILDSKNIAYFDNYIPSKSIEKGNKESDELKEHLNSLTKHDFLVVLRADNFIQKLELADTFNTMSGLTNSPAKSLVFHMLASFQSILTSKS